MISAVESCMSFQVRKSLRRFTLDDVAAVTRACQDPEIPR